MTGRIVPLTVRSVYVPSRRLGAVDLSPPPQAAAATIRTMAERRRTRVSGWGSPNLLIPRSRRKRGHAVRRKYSPEPNGILTTRSAPRLPGDDRDPPRALADPDVAEHRQRFRVDEGDLVAHPVRADQQRTVRREREPPR